MSTPRILLLDAPTFSSRRLLRVLEENRLAATRVEGEPEALRALATGEVALLLLAADRVGPALTRALEDAEASPPFVLLDDLGSAARAAPALRARAFETVVRPAADSQVLAVVRAALERGALAHENARLRHEADGSPDLPGIVTRDGRMRSVLATVEAVASSRATILIQGESGTGKTVLARAIHLRSDRPEAPFVVVNCGALPGSLLATELFGHVRGAFTGAVKDHPGKFEAADGGTIFLDEVGTASPDLQVKLLRVLEEGTFERVGDSASRTVDVRVIAATNVELSAEVEAGRFRPDLFYRLDVVRIDVPPLRERAGDVHLLAEAFVRRFALRHDRPVRGITPAALARIAAHAWPGNVRELENSIERAVLLARGPLLEPGDLWPEDADGSQAYGGDAPRLEDLPLGPLREALEVPERWLVLRALLHHGGSRQEAARTLGINRTTLFNKMRKFGLLDLPTAIPPSDLADLPSRAESRDSLDRAG